MPERKTNALSRRTEISRRLGATAIQGPILIVNDNPDDAKLAQRAFERLNPRSPVTVVGAGPALVKYLEGLAASPPTTPAIPSLILLDLKMPEMDGFAILAWMAKQPRFASIPVIILSTFDDLPHMRQAYSLGARSYLLKPINTEPLRNALLSLNIAV